MMRKSELLLPAGSLLKLKTAILYGADAVYAGTPDMSLRTQSKFSLEDLQEGIEFVHAHGKKIYLTLNLYIHNEEAKKLPQFVETLKKLQPDGVLVADPGVFYYLQQNAPELKRFVSTQANICSAQTVKFWQSMGASLCVLGREVTFAEMKEIREECPDIKLECFIHGAMCMSYSGRCLISNFMADRSANKGKCAHCCRWHYKMHLRLKDGTIKEIEINEDNAKAFEFLLEEEFRPGEYYEIVEDEHGGYLLNSKDMCLMPRLADILALGIDSLKVEGRNKTEYYAGTVARAYRQAIDDYYANPQEWHYEKYMNELYALQNRGYCLGFHDGKLTEISQNYEYTRTLGEWLFAGSIVEWQGDEAIFEIRNYINSGESIEFLVPGGLENLSLTLSEFEDAESGEITPRVSAGEEKKIRIRPDKWPLKIEKIKEMLPQYTIARKFQGLNGENQEMYERKKAEFAELIENCPAEE
ncbi:MAG: U32 family peptidase C-terminal domain-containing protein [Alphaproteobacteria bacterium]|nr:U32 family peptidase C-terminal domain-containing protein [Alphaproteobacteria bacterium]